MRYALRSFRQSPGLAAVAIASLALGIGANVTIYSVVREMILDDISAHQPDRLARVDGEFSYTQYLDLKRAEAFRELAFDTGFEDATWQDRNSPEVIWQAPTSANFFDVLGVEAFAGQLYAQRDNGRPVAVVSYGFWRNRLHADPKAVGRSLQINGQLYRITGVLPRDYRSIFGHGISPEVYRLARTDALRCYPFGRMRDGFTRDQTRQALIAAAQRIGGVDFAKHASVIKAMAGLAAHETSQGDDHGYFMFFVMLFATAFLLGVIACFNVAGLLLSRGVSRERELAVRRALGATRFQLLRHILGEGLVLVVLGAAAGLIVDGWLRHRLSYVRWPSAYNIPFEFHFQNDRGLFFYAMATALVALLISSLIPALRGSNTDLGLAMKQGEPAFSVRRWNLRNIFVSMQLALSLVLLMLGGLFVRSFLRVSTIDPGFDAPHLAIAVVHSPKHRGPNASLWRDGVVRRIEEVPGVVGVTSIGTLPFMAELPEEVLRRRGDPATLAQNTYSVGAGERFCSVLGSRLLRGRDFELADRTRQPVPVLIDETLARRLFGNADPIGAHLLAGREHERLLQIIGVTADVKMRTLGEASAPLLFTPFFDAQLLVRLNGDPAQWTQPLRNVLTGVDASAPIDVRLLSDATAGAIFPMRVGAGFIGALSGIGLLLVLAGLYSSVSYATRRRTRELAIRAAMGGAPSTILWTAIRDGIAVLALGLAAGLPLAIAAMHPLTDVVPDGVDPWSPWMFLGIGLLLITTGAGAAWVPARFAANVDPSLALRQE